MDQPHTAYAGNQPFVFVSYSHIDKAIVYPEIRWLQDQGINVWFDEGISGGSRWRDSIAGNISGCSLFVLYISLHSAASQVCREELEYALDRGVTILAIYLEPTDLPEGMRLAISNRQALNRHDIFDDDYQRKLLAAITSELSLPHIIPSTPMPRRQRAASVRYRTLALVLLVGVCTGLLGAWFGTAGSTPARPSTSESFTLDIVLSPPLVLARNEIGVPLSGFALSDDGTVLVYVAQAEDGRFLYSRNMLTRKTRRLPGTANAALPLISPDGATVAFFVGNELRRIAIEGGPVSTIATINNPTTAVWPEASAIAVQHSDASELTFVDPDSGGKDSRIINQFFILPLGRDRMIYSDDSDLLLEDLETGEVTPLGVRGFAAYTSQDILLSVMATGLSATRFNEEEPVPSGETIVLSSPVRVDTETINWALGGNGLFVYWPGDNSGLRSALAWVEKDGKPTPLAYDDQRFGTFSISPDGTMIAVVRHDSDASELWIYDTQDSFARRIASRNSFNYIVDITWTADSQALHVADVSSQDQATSWFYSLGTDVLSVTELAINDAYGIESTSASGDLFSVNSSGGIGIYERVTDQLISVTSDETAWGSELRPDGSGVAFVSSRSGSYQIYYVPMPFDGRIIQVSRDPGSEEPRWSRDGNRLYFRNGRRIMVTEYVGAKQGHFSRPSVFYEGEFDNVAGRSYDISPDETKALVLPSADMTTSVLTVETNWFQKFASQLDATRKGSE